MHNPNRPPERCSGWPNCDFCYRIPSGDPFYVTAETLDPEGRTIITLVDQPVHEGEELVYLNREDKR